MKRAVYSGTRHIYDDMVVSAKSLATHSDVDEIYFLIEDDEFPYVLPDYVRCINVSDQTYFRSNGPNMNSEYTYMAMMRAALCHIFDYETILSLDADTICVADISDVWDIPLGNSYFAAAIEPDRCYGGLIYTNIGVSLYNLDKLRDGKADEVISVLNSAYFRWVEQDAMNYLCQGRISIMSGDYNACTWTVHASPKIKHFAGIKEWQDFPEAQKYRQTGWNEIR